MLLSTAKQCINLITAAGLEGLQLVVPSAYWITFQADLCCLPLQVEKGSTAAVFGLGTIGLAVVDALQEAGARRIIGVDTDEGKFARAKEWGATDLINPAKYDKPIQVGLAHAGRC